MSFQKITCPHCIRQVSVHTDDATCPACRGNTAQRNAETEGLSLVEFVDGENLPPFCVLCGRSTDHAVEVGERNETKRDVWFSLSRILGAFAGAHAISNRPALSVKEWKISVKLPVCESHRESRYLNPTYVDYDKYRITVPAHRKFIEQWKRPGSPGR